MDRPPAPRPTPVDTYDAPIAHVELLGDATTGLAAVSLGDGASRPQFEAFTRVCKAGRARYASAWRHWQLPARLVAPLLDELRRAGFELVEQPASAPSDAFAALVLDRYGARAAGDLRVSLDGDRFAVHHADALRLPCGLLEAVVLARAGVAIDDDARQRLAALLDAAAADVAG